MMKFDAFEFVCTRVIGRFYRNVGRSNTCSARLAPKGYIEQDFELKVDGQVRSS